MLEAFSYCPTLYARVAEVKALFQLPAATKDRLFPLMVARPWPNANHLQRTWEKISEAVGSRRYAIDLDRTNRNAGGDKPAAQEFDSLFDSAGGFLNYYNLVESVPQATPVLRLQGGMAADFDTQAENIDRLDRGLIVRIEHDFVRNPLALIDRVLERFADVSLFVDAGWSNDLLSREIWASAIVERAAERRPEIELVAVGSSFPDSFVSMDERGVIPVTERRLFSNLVRRHNAAIITYGDWGSTRPPSSPVPMKNIPRIDLPTPNTWISFRRDREFDIEETYAEIAQRVIDDDEWPGDLSIWGTYTIGCTARELPGAIRSPALATAARVNIHLHRQAFFDAPAAVSDGDEPFTDD